MNDSSNTCVPPRHFSRLRAGDAALRRRYVHLMVEKVVVGETEIRISGSPAVIAQAALV